VHPSFLSSLSRTTGRCALGGLNFILFGISKMIETEKDILVKKQEAFTFCKMSENVPFWGHIVRIQKMQI
jgi:hypothetical protein